MRKKKIVITGGSGDIAQAIYKKLKDRFEVYTPSKDELDVRWKTHIEKYMKHIKPDILINNAGYIKPERIIDLKWSSFFDHFYINVFGAVFCSKYAILNGCSLIINIGSSAGSKGKAGWSAYSASKAGLIRLTESLYDEGHPAVCISPGRTRTKMRSKLYPDEDVSTLLNPSDVADVVSAVIEDPIPFYGRNIGVKQTGKGVVTFLHKEAEECIQLL